ncbi:MAG: archease, partial [Candidatus Diapherotrites archaeon]|nr:archease [Candidatus Diapherotrites archaeon]
EETAKALTEIMVKIETVKPKEKRELWVNGTDEEVLLVAFLNELLFFKDKEQLVFSKFKVTIEKKAGQIRLKAMMFGEKINPKKHKIFTDAKAATYSELKVEKEGKVWTAQCIVDV